MKYKRKEVIGDCTLYLADCMDVIPHLGRVDAVVTDPPYGIGIDGQKENIKGKKSDRKGYEFKGWDNKTPNKEVFDIIFSKSSHQIIWGGTIFKIRLIELEGDGYHGIRGNMGLQ